MCKTIGEQIQKELKEKDLMLGELNSRLPNIHPENTRGALEEMEGRGIVEYDPSISKWRLIKQDAKPAMKLVRNKIPDRIMAKGEFVTTGIANKSRVEQLLRDKLMEEVGEYINSNDVQEIVDILEVAFEIALSKYGISQESMMKAMQDKRATHGGFSNRVLLVVDKPKEQL